MKHLGDITKISGYTAPIVDCIIGGSPCQDLSVAGKRAGLDGERSGLFIEQVRIAKEMRDRDKRNGRTGVDVRCRYLVWENVCGSLSSPGKDRAGEDFRVVLEELARVVDEGVSIPRPPKGKWSNTGVIVGDGYSIAWRVTDSQFHGVPQRRRRITLVADFNGDNAPRIVFGESEHHGSSVRDNSESSIGCVGGKSRSEIQPLCNRLPRDSEPSQKKRKGSPSDATGGFGADDYQCITFEPGIASREGGHVYEGVSGTLRANAVDNQMATAYTMQDREGKAGGGKGALIAEELSATLRANNAQYLFQPVYSVENHPNDSRVGINEDGLVQTLSSRMGTGGGNVPMVLALDRASFNQGKNAQFDFEVSDKGINSPIVAKGPSAVCYGINGDTAGTLDSSYYKGCGMRSGVEREVIAQAVDCRNCTEDDINGSLQSNSAHSLNGNNVVRIKYIVRRLTPLECERLQGYPDGWTDIGDWVDSSGKKRQTSDAARYKALGNSIALPPWKWILKRISACYERDATMASLFDGISGFVLLWTQLNGLGSVKWTSEIEEFPMAVCKRHFGDEETGEKGDFYEAILGRNKTEDG